MALFALVSAHTVWAGDLDLPEKPKEPFVNRIIIEGNESFSDKDLKRRMFNHEAPFFAIFTKPRLDRDALRRDVGSLQAFYRTSGFLEATVRVDRLSLLENGTFVDIVIQIDEGVPTRVKFVSFQGYEPIAEDKLIRGLRLKPGVPFNPSLVNGDIYSIKRKYFDKGYVAVEVVDSVAVNGKEVNLRYRISPGPVITVRRISITGNRLTKTHIVEREIVIKEGETFRLSKAIETQRNLFETGLFTEAEIIPENLDVESRTVDVLVRVREKKSAYFEIGFGVGNILGSRISGEWGDRNVFGRGRGVRLRSEYSFGLFEEGELDFDHLNPWVKFYRYELEFSQRHVFGTKVLLGVDAYIEKDGTVEPLIIRTRGGGVTAGRHLSPRTDVAGRFSDRRIKREVPDLGTEKSHTRLIGSMISHDTRDFILDPHRGGYRDFRVELAGGIFGADNDFYTLNTALQKYWPKGRSTVYAVRARIGFADAYGASKNEGVPVENRYFSGGGNSVRGFRENSLGPRELIETSSGVIEEAVVGGRLLIVTNAEVRFAFPYLSKFNFSGAAFVDAGNVWRSLGSVSPSNFRVFVGKDEVTDEDFRYSVGMGIRYNTPVGPIRLDYGIPIKRTEEESFGRFHISLGQIF